MNRLLRTISLALIILCGSFFAPRMFAQCGGNAGNEFWIAFMENYEKPARQVLFITAEKNTTIKVEVTGKPTQTITVMANVVQSVPIDSSYVDKDNGVVTSKAVHLYSTDGTNLTVYALSRENNTTDATSCLPVSALGSAYRAASYTSYTSGANYYSGFCIIGVANNTSVKITFPGAGNPQRTVTLNTGQTYFIRGGNLNPPPNGIDISGTLIDASKPVAVFCGHGCARVPDTSGACDHLYEELLPISAWGQLHYTIPFAMRKRGDTFRIFADSNGTDVYINGLLKTTLSGGSFYETILTTPSEIYGSKPIEVMQYANGQFYDNTTGDPAMMLVPSVSNYVGKSIITTTPAGSDAFLINYLAVIVPTAEINNVKLDAAQIPAFNFKPFVIVKGSTPYSWDTTAIAIGQHTLSWKNPTASRMVGFQYGWSATDSYAYSAGFVTLSDSLPHLSIAGPPPFDAASCPGSFVDTVVYATNICTKPVTITGKQFTGPDEAQYSFLSDPIGKTLLQGESLPVAIRLTPTSFGAKQATLELTSNAPMVSTNLLITVRKQLRPTSGGGTVSGGSIPVRKTASATSTLNNPDNIPLHVNAVYFTPATSDITITPLPVTLPANSTTTFTYSFRPTIVGTYSGSACFVIDSPCPDTVCVPLTYTGIGQRVTICPQFSPLLSKVIPGDVFEIPFVLDSAVRYAEPGPDTLSLLINYDSEVLALLDVRSAIGGSVASQSNDRNKGTYSFLLRGINKPLNAGIVAYVKMQALLGTHSDAFISVTSGTIPTPSNEVVVSGAECSPTTFMMDSSCIHPTTLEKRAGSVILSNYPNPFTRQTSILLSSDQTETIELRILDVFGRTVRILYRGEITKGIHGFDMDAGTLPAGMYVCQLVTAKNVSSHRMVIN